MSIATVRTGNEKFECSVMQGCRTMHSLTKDQVKHEEGDICDDRVPEGFIVSHGSNGTSYLPAVQPLRPQGKIGPRTLIVEEVDGKWRVAPGTSAVTGDWNSTWIYIECSSEGHAEHTLGRLRRGITESDGIAKVHSV